MSASNSSRIEQATRQHVGAVLTSQMIADLVKASDPTNTKGVYPSDCAYKRQEDGVLVPRGKTAYGDGILEYLAENSFKVLPTEQIVRRKPAKAASSTPTVPVPTPTVTVTPVASAPTVPKKKGKKTGMPSSKPPVADKRLGAAGKEARA